MKASAVVALISFLVLVVNALKAQDHRDPLGEILISPHVILRQAERIGLTSQRRAEIEAATKQLQARSGPLQERIGAAREALAESLRKPGAVDESETGGKIDELLEAEREGKRAHLESIIKINALLTPQQRRQLQRGRTAGQQLPTQPGPGPDAADGPKPPLPAMLDASSPDELNAMVDGLRAPDVAWRKIPWKTCLLEGVRESRDQKKPIILWVFIDLPVDDKRC